VVMEIFSAVIMIGWPTMGALGDTIERINLSILCTVQIVLRCFLIWMFATSYAVLILFTLCNGIAVLWKGWADRGVGEMSGIFWTMATPVTAGVVGLQDLASALLLLRLIGTVLSTTCRSRL